MASRVPSSARQLEATPQVFAMLVHGRQAITIAGIADWRQHMTVAPVDSGVRRRKVLGQASQLAGGKEESQAGAATEAQRLHVERA
jgi:hypothetical protein